MASFLIQSEQIPHIICGDTGEAHLTEHGRDVPAVTVYFVRTLNAGGSLPRSRRYT